MKKLLAFVFALLLPLAAFAQTPVVGQQALAWDQSAASLAEAQSLGFKLFIDGGSGAVFPGVTCTGTASPFVCKANLPALTSGPHSLVLTATLAGQESAPSTALAIQVVVLAAPQNLRITPP